jgi:hypothetical protein
MPDATAMHAVVISFHTGDDSQSTSVFDPCSSNQKLWNEFKEMKTINAKDRVTSNGTPAGYSVEVGATRKYKNIVTTPIMKNKSVLVRAMLLIFSFMMSASFVDNFMYA